MLILIRGNACSGKSTIAEKLRNYFKDLKKTAVIHTTVFYWEMVFGDSSDVVMENTKRILDNYLKNGYDVILEGTLSNRKEDGKLYIMDFLKLAKKYNVPTKEFFFEADLCELEKREKIRKKIPIKRLKEFYERTHQTKRKEEIVIDTSKKSLNQVLKEVKKYLKN
jgi:predicted kinase